MDTSIDPHETDSSVFEWDLGPSGEDDRDYPVLLCTDY